jgi:hypothetical protein
MTHTFMCFFHFHFTEEYKQYLFCNDAELQRESTAYLQVTDTKLFALNSSEGRRNAVCNLIGLVRFWKNQRPRTDDNDIEGTDIDRSKEGDSEMNNDDNNNEESRKRKRRRQT